MKCFDILGISDFSSTEKINDAYYKAVQRINDNRDIYSNDQYRLKIEELKKAYQDCLDYKKQNIEQKIILQTKSEVSKLFNTNYLYSSNDDGGCCAMICGLPCMLLVCDLCCSGLCGAIGGDYGEPLCSKICDPAWCDDNGNQNSVIDAELARRKAAAEREEQEERRRQEIYHQKLRKEKEEEKIIKQKTKEINKNNASINKKIARYHQLQSIKSSGINSDKCESMISLIKQIDNSRGEHFEKLFKPYISICHEMKEIEETVEHVAQLYREIGNFDAASKLINSFKQRK